jgi:hypothetical protein
MTHYTNKTEDDESLYQTLLISTNLCMPSVVLAIVLRPLRKIFYNSTAADGGGKRED